MNNVLRLHNITKNYHQGDATLEVLRGANLTLKAGEVVALVGPSGAGKTTLLQITGLLDSPSDGEIEISGIALAHAKEAERTKMRSRYLGFVYQSHHLLPEFSALENVVLPQLIAGVDEKSAIEKARTLLNSLGLSSRETHRPAKLSGGEQQRVAIARALINDPVLLLADEPTGNLDPKTAEDAFTLFMSLAKQRGLAALVATHNMDLAKRMDRIVKIENGILT